MKDTRTWYQATVVGMACGCSGDILKIDDAKAAVGAEVVDDFKSAESTVRLAAFEKTSSLAQEML